VNDQAGHNHYDTRDDQKFCHLQKYLNALDWMSNKANLFLIPSAIAASPIDAIVPPSVRNQLAGVRCFLVEDIRTARRYLSSLKIYEKIEALSFSVLDKDTPESALSALFEPVFQGHHLGVLSESGCPGIADPGAMAVRFAHQNGIKVIPLVGPSAIFLSLMASGLNGQHFAFHGYLPIKINEAARAIKELESESAVKNQTQIFIETPYRNNTLFANLVRNLMPDTQLCLAVDVTGKEEFILTQPVRKWRLQSIALPKSPAVFLFLA
jgi:16S rRNA (cytidine1402-2'-O)-methyltransferase